MAQSETTTFREALVNPGLSLLYTSAFMTGCFHCILRILSVWDTNFAIAAATVMWLDQIFIVSSVSFLMYDLYDAKNHYQDEAEFVNEMRDIVKEVVAKRNKRALKLSALEEKSESDSDKTDDEGNDTVSSESDAKIFGIN